MTFQTELRSVKRGMMCVLLVSTLALPTTFGFSRIPLPFCSALTSSSSSSLAGTGTGLAAVASSSNDVQDDTLASSAGEDTDARFEEFVEFLQTKQTEIIQQLEAVEAKLSGATFSRDAWGLFQDEKVVPKVGGGKNSGGITRVIQGGSVVEKGACSLTVIREGILTADRAATIRSRQAEHDNDNANSIQAGDKYSAAALSMVLDSSHPMVPTFRSDVRVFLVQSESAPTAAGGGGKDTTETLAWFGGGADLTPYYLFEEDVQFFHGLYPDLCDNSDLSESGLDSASSSNSNSNSVFSYASMKKVKTACDEKVKTACDEKVKTACDDYFYLPARGEHHGTGGIFFDDMPVTPQSTTFVQGVTDTWMPSWLFIVEQRQSLDFTS
jgi:coproporphyrinogen III oxidase